MKNSLLALVVWGLSTLVQAHNLDISQAVIEVEETKALLVVTPPSSVFKSFDDNHDGFMNVEEVKIHRVALNQFFSEHVSILNERGAAGQFYFFDIIVPGAFEDAPEGSDHLRFMRRYEWKEAPEAITFRYDFVQDGGELVTTVALGDKTQTVLFSGAQPEYTFGEKAQPNLQQFLVLGVKHILTGYDHLLFLLSLLLAAGSLGSMLKTISAFTVAHSVTLALTVLGILTVPPYFVEGVIALSIAFVALENLWKHKINLRWPWLVVFGFGLVHGMGFAGVLSDIGLPSANVLPSLLSFNIGVELGQIAFVLVVSLLLVFARRVRVEQFLQRWGSVGVAGIALYWSFERFFS